LAVSHPEYLYRHFQINPHLTERAIKYEAIFISNLEQIEENARALAQQFQVKIYKTILSRKWETDVHGKINDLIPIEG
jgi:hypothetical protein